MKYSHLEDKIKEMIGKNGYVKYDFPFIHSHLHKRDFKSCKKIINNCDLLKKKERKFLLNYIKTFKNAC